MNSDTLQLKLQELFMFRICKFIIMLFLLTGISSYALPMKDTDTEKMESRSEESDTTSKNQDLDNITLPTITVVGKRTISAASDNTVRSRDFMNYPRRTASDLMRFVPGLYITQHTGGAKAHQIFLRGFDAEHGQDIAAFLDGIPINESSHVHGQGYLDLHFLIPESIQKIWIMKGPYDPRYGNYANAGVIDFIPYKKRSFNYSADLGGGSKKTAEMIFQSSQDIYEMNNYLVLEGDRTDGYTNPGELRAGRCFINHTIPLTNSSEMRFLYAGYSVRSKAADILPKQYIDSDLISRFNALDNSNKVNVDRHILGVTYELKKNDIETRIQAYYNYKDTQIFSNYTFYYYNPERGDQLEQSDSRHYTGLQGYIRRIFKYNQMEFSTEGGITLRSDFVDQTQANTEDRTRYNVMNHYNFNETALGAYLDERITMFRWIKIILGIRYDVIWYNGDGEQDKLEFDIYTNGSITTQDNPVNFSTYAQTVSPKASVIFSPVKELDIFLNYGAGFVSSQARHIAWQNDNSIPRVTGGEIGSRARLLKGRLNCAASAWIAEKESDSIFDSEFGTSIPRGKSRRTGVDFEIRVSPWTWLYVGTDVNYVKARFVKDDEPIPNMSEWLMTNVISVIHPDGYKGALRGRYLGERKHDLGYRSNEYYVVDLLMGYEFSCFSIALSVENIFDTVWYDSVFAYTSRPEEDGSEVEGLHVTPGTPRMWRLRVGAKF